MELVLILDIEYFFYSEEYVDIYIYFMVFLYYSKFIIYLIMGNKFFFDDVIENDDSGIDSEFELLFVDFVCMVIFMFFKVFLGVVCYKDFI